MKYSLPNRMRKHYLKQADEIKFEYKDIDALFDYFEEYPDKEFVLCIGDSDSPDIDKIITYNKIAEGRFSVELEHIAQYEVYKRNNIKYFWKYPATTPFELWGLTDIGVSQILIDAPLFFKLKDIKKETNTPLRVIPNVCYEKYIPRENGINGSWVRPQDIPLYEDYITTFEFKADHLTQYEGLFDIYKKGNYIDRLDILFRNFDVPLYATGILPDVIETRLNCGQHCRMYHRPCQLCFKAVEAGLKVQEELTPN